MRKSFRKAAVIVTIAATILATVMRVLLTPGMQDADTGAFHLSYVVIGILLAGILAAFVLVFTGDGPIPHIHELSKQSCAPLAVAALIFGSCLIGASLLYTWMWMVFGDTPAPNSQVISQLDGISLALTLLFGVLAGLFMVWLGITLLSGKQPVRTSSLALAALAPVVWTWVRLVRYEVSYASAIQVYQSFYDFVMLIFTMLFLFAFARYLTGTGEKSPRMLFACGLCTVLLSVSGPIAGILLYMNGETAAYNSSRLADATDFGAGIFALVLTATLAFVKTVPAKEDADELPLDSEQPAAPLEETEQEDAPADAVPPVQPDTQE